jgi:hypothetical protein
MLNAKAIADYTGISDRTIRDWLNRRILPKTQDMSTAIQAILAYKDQQIEELRERRSGNNDELTEEKIRFTRAQADKLKLEIQEREGQLVNAREVVMTWSGYIFACRSRLLSLPSKLAYEIAGISEPALCQALMAEAVDEALAELGGEEFVERLRSVEGDDISIQAAAQVDDQPMG